jgi:hypothetical protein
MNGNGQIFFYDVVCLCNQIRPPLFNRSGTPAAGLNIGINLSGLFFDPPTYM